MLVSLQDYSSCHLFVTFYQNNVVKDRLVVSNVMNVESENFKKYSLKCIFLKNKERFKRSEELQSKN